MVDQVIDEYQDATGIDAGASTNERAAGATTAKYYDGGTTVTPSVTGGATTVVGDYTYHVFTSGTVNYVTDTTQDLDFLVVAGGGSGGFGESGGGGAGGLIYRTEKSVANGTYSVTVGAGGGTGDPGNSGADSTFGSLFTAKGGGYGGYYSGPVAAASGGSGGGADHNGDTTFGTSTQAGQSGDSGTYGFGFAGGRGDTGSSHGNAQGSGGGGGAGGLGGDAGDGTGGGRGGLGKELTLFNRWGTTSANVATTGTDGGWFASGGGGGRYNSPNSTGTASAGGGSAGTHTTTAATDALANTGGGGGGNGSSSTSYQAEGGSGIVIVRRPTILQTPGANLTLQSVETTAESAPTTADLVMLIEDNEGTATINTDIKAKVSRDGTDFGDSYVTLVDEGNWGTDKRILVARNIDLTATHDTGTAMKYKIETFNQSAGVKETRIHATSLAWA